MEERLDRYLKKIQDENEKDIKILKEKLGEEEFKRQFIIAITKVITRAVIKIVKLIFILTK